VERDMAFNFRHLVVMEAKIRAALSRTALPIKPEDCKRTPDPRKARAAGARRGK
jgi:hypothetical protein